MKGRKPKSDATRRKKKAPAKKQQPVEELVATTVQAAPTLAIPESVSLNPTMYKCWNLIVGDGAQYTEADIPGLEQMCYWYAVYQQCMYNTLMPDGRVITRVGRKVDGEEDVSTLKQHPDIKTAQQAANMFRQLASEYGVSPLARQRLGLMDAMTRSTQADLVKKTEELFARFEGRLDAPK